MTTVVLFTKELFFVSNYQSQKAGQINLDCTWYGSICVGLEARPTWCRVMGRWRRACGTAAENQASWGCSPGACAGWHWAWWGSRPCPGTLRGSASPKTSPALGGCDWGSSLGSGWVRCLQVGGLGSQQRNQHSHRTTQANIGYNLSLHKEYDIWSLS